MLTDPERILFRRLAAFLGGFDLDAAQAVASDADVERYQVIDQLALLVDKSLVIAETSGSATRYRLLGTVRQYALEKLGKSGEADVVRSRHRDHYTAMAAALDVPARTDYEQLLDRAEIEIDNLRAAFGWNLENSNIEQALMLASSVQPLWLTRGPMREGWAWFDTVLTAAGADDASSAAVHARALADRALLSTWVGFDGSVDQAQQALSVARAIGDPSLLVRALTACGNSTAYNAELAEPYFTEAIGLARALDDRWRLTQILGWQANAAIVAGDPTAARAAAEEGLDLATATGDRFGARHCRYCLGTAHQFQGELSAALAQFDMLAAEADAAHDLMRKGLRL